MMSGHYSSLSAPKINPQFFKSDCGCSKSITSKKSDDIEERGGSEGTDGSKKRRFARSVQCVLVVDISGHGQHFFKMIVNQMNVLVNGTKCAKRVVGLISSFFD
jgi:hypothetical protein